MNQEIGSRNYMIEIVGYNKKIATIICDCGKTKEILKANFFRTKSCGCKTIEMFKNSKKEIAHTRKYINHPNHIELELSGGEYVKLDYDDYLKVKDYSWYKSIRKSVESRIDGKLIKIHRLIMNYPVEIIDHINGDTLDNRKSNLRICNSIQNCWNSKKRIGCSSKYKGVYFSNKEKKFISRITQNNKTYILGRFLNEIDAALCYNENAKKYYGEFAKLNIIG